MGRTFCLRRHWRQLVIFLVVGLVYAHYRIGTISSQLSVHSAGNTGYADNLTNGRDAGPTSYFQPILPPKPNLTCHANVLGIPKAVQNSECITCQLVTCKNLLYGNGSEYFYGKAIRWMNEHPRKIPADSQVEEMAKDCNTFKEMRGYYLHPVNEEEANFSIAYNIIIHKDASQVEQLLRAIYRPQNVYCIHIDGKSPQTLHSAIQAITSCFTNVFIASKTERIVYAGYSRLQADINCMEDMAKLPNWKYLINLAGQAFPLKTNSEIVKILKIYNGANDIEGIYGKRILKSRFQNEWVEIGVNTSTPEIKKTGRTNPQPPYDIEIVRGSAYGIFSREFVKFIVTDNKARALLEWSRKTYSPDEHYWATLHHSYSNPHLGAPGAFSGYPSEKLWLAVYVAWGGVDKCAGQWRRGTCVFGVGDLPNLITRRELFANKFYANYQPLVLDCLEAWIEHKTVCPTDIDELYYKNLPFIKKDSRL